MYLSGDTTQIHPQTSTKCELLILKERQVGMSELKLNKIGQIAVNVDDLAVAVEFYRDTLGLKFLFQVPAMAFFDCGGVRLLINEVEAWQHPSSIIYYKVDDLSRNLPNPLVSGG